MTGRIESPGELQRSHSYTFCTTSVHAPRSIWSRFQPNSIHSVIDRIVDEGRGKTRVEYHHPQTAWHVLGRFFFHPETGWADGPNYLMEVFDEGLMSPDLADWRESMERQKQTEYRLSIAGQLAKFILATWPYVARVGLYGSVAREEATCHDLDLVAFTYDEEATLTDYLEAVQWKESEGYAIDVQVAFRILGGPDAFRQIETQLYGSSWFDFCDRRTAGTLPLLEDRVYQPLHFTVLPHDLDGAFSWLQLFQKTQYDDRFLENLFRDCRLYDPIKNRFEASGIIRDEMPPELLHATNQLAVA